MLRRIALFIVACTLIACSGSRSKPIEETLPAQVGPWTKTQSTPIDAASAPEIVRQLGLKRAVTATYTGPATVAVRIFEMNVPTSAFELIQKWRQQDGLAVYNGPYFIVADPSVGAAASSLLEGLRKQMQ